MSSSKFTRRGLLLGGAASALALSSAVTVAQTPFTTFAFPATGATSSRTDPDRWGDWVNVKDYGAKGDNSTNDATAVNAAIAAAAAKGSVFEPGAVVYFPPGAYVIGAALFNNISGSSVSLIGSGKHSTILSGNFSGYVIDQNDGSYSGPTRLGIINTIADMTVQNTSMPAVNGIDATRGAIRFNGSNAGVIRNVFASGWTAICATSNVFVTHIQEVELSGIGGGAGSVGYGSVGALLGQVKVTALTALGFTYAVIGGGTALGSLQGPYISGLRMEDNIFGLVLGMAVDLSNCPAVGFHIDGVQTERCNNSIVIQDAAGGRLSGLFISGTLGVAEIVNSISGNGTTVTVNTALALDLFGWTSGTRSITISDSNNGTPGPYEMNNVFATATRVTSTQFTYPSSATGSSVGNPVTWSPKQTCGIQVQNAGEIQFSGVEVLIQPTNLQTGGAGIDLYAGGGAQLKNIKFEETVALSWNMPIPINKASVQYVNCDNPTGTTSDQRSAQSGMNFADLPGQSSVIQPGPTEDQTYDIVDCSTSTFLATAAGGGSGASAHRRVRYNAAASAWQVVG